MVLALVDSVLGEGQFPSLGKVILTSQSRHRRTSEVTNPGSDPNFATYWLLDLGKKSFNLFEPQCPHLGNGVKNSTCRVLTGL